MGKASHSKLGMASRNKWTWRSTENGHGVPENILHLGGNMVQTFFPHRCNDQWESQVKAAFDWITETAKWQELPSYEPILGYLQFFRQACAKPGGPKWPFLSEAAKQPAMVAKKYDKSRRLGLNNARCEHFLPIAQQPFNVSLLRKSR